MVPIQNPSTATSLNVPLVPLDMFAADATDPAEFARELKRQLRIARMSIVQLHAADGTVEQWDSRTVAFAEDILVSVGEASVRGIQFFLIAVARAVPPGELHCIFGELEADTDQVEEGRPTKFAGVNELAQAIGAGTAAARVDVNFHTHRRPEIAAHVTEVVACRSRPEDAELRRIKLAAVEFLAAIDAAGAEPLGEAAVPSFVLYRGADAAAN